MPPSIPGLESVPANREPLYRRRGKGITSPGPGRTLSALLSPVLKRINDSLAEITVKFSETPGAVDFLLLLFLSFIYGIIHAAGPGHGKTIVLSYFLAYPGTYPKALFSGLFIALIHASSAVSVVVLLSFIIRTLFSTGFETVSRIISAVSYSMVLILGLSGLIISLFRKKNQDPEKTEKPKSGSLPLLCIAAGIVPCPGAVTLLLFSLSLNIFRLGLFSVAAMSIGMAVTISAAGVLTILAKKGILRKASVDNTERGSPGSRISEGKSGIIKSVLEITGYTLLILSGTLLLLTLL